MTTHSLLGRASGPRLLRAPLWRALGIPLWGPAPRTVAKPLVSPRIGAKIAPSQPFSLLLMSVVEEIIGFQGARVPSAAEPGAHRRRAGGRSRATTREQS